MKTKLYVTYVILAGSLMASVMSNAMDLTKRDSIAWLNILHDNGIPNPKAERCARLLPQFLCKHPKSVAELSTLQNKPHPMQVAVWHALCDELIRASQRNEL